jgi:hypothetical protein
MTDGPRVIPSLRPVLPVRNTAFEDDMNQTVREIHNKSIAMRTAARQDATIVVARARERGGASPTAWSAFDADAVHLITDLLLKLQGQAPSPLDPAFAARDAALAMTAGQTGRIEEAIKRGADGDKALEEDSGRPESGPRP